MKLIFIALFLVSCGTVERVAPDDTDNLGALETMYQSKIKMANELSESSTGWLNFSDGDALLWDLGKYGSSPAVTLLPRASEFEDSGRFGRRPPAGQSRCWTPEDGDICAAATWSRDMGVGLITYGVRRNNLTLLEDHAAYGEGHTWYMGAPLADGRTIYTPVMVGLLYNAIYGLGGKDSVNRHIPDPWTSGLDDYQAHIQMMKILIHSQLSKKSSDIDDISEKMVDRIKEHYEREPHSLFYSYLHTLYNGGMSSVVDLCLDNTIIPPEYVRCGEKEKCALAEWIFACGLVLEEYELY